MRKLSAGLLIGLLCPLAAFAFPVDVEIESKGVSIIASSSYLSNIATVTLANEGAEQAMCRATFVNGPERPPERRIRIDPGEHRVLTQAFTRHINRVRVAISCEPVSEPEQSTGKFSLVLQGPGSYSESLKAGQ